MCMNCVELIEDVIDTDRGTYFIQREVHLGCIECASALVMQLFDGVLILDDTASLRDSDSELKDEIIAELIPV